MVLGVLTEAVPDFGAETLLDRLSIAITTHPAAMTSQKLMRR
jgi:hypothetical protein